MNCVVGQLRLLRAALVAVLTLSAAIPLAYAADEETAIFRFQRNEESLQASPPLQTIHADTSVTTIGYTMPDKSDPKEPIDQRILTPPLSNQTTDWSKSTSETPRPAKVFDMPQIESLTTAGAGLAVVVGLFLLCATMLRRGGPQPNSPLPQEAVAVLGRVPLTARNFAHLLQVGNKLVLVAMTPDGAQPITEITEPTEVQRLLGLCLRTGKQSTTAEFQQVMQQLAAEPAHGFLGNQASTPPTRANR